LKNYEAFSTSVYAKADVRRKKIRERNRMISQASLCVVMVAAVAAFSGIYSRDKIKPRIVLNDAQPIASESVPRKVGEKDRPQMLVVRKEGGASKASVLKNPEEQQVYMRQLSPEDNGGKASLDQENAEGITIHSLAELLRYLELLPSDSLPDMEEYDEEFFAHNDLYVMPLDLNTDDLPEDAFPEEDEPAEEDTAEVTTTEYVLSTTTLAALPTIPDDTPGDGVVPGNADPNAAASELTTIPPFPSSDAAAADNNAAASSVRVFLLVPVSKTEVELATAS